MLKVANFTAIQPAVSSDNEAADQAATLFRGNSDVTLVNGVLVAPNNECIRMNGSGTTPSTLTPRSVVMQCNATKFLGTGAYTATQVGGFFGSGANSNNDAFTPTLASLFINGANETGVAAIDPKSLSSFFDTTTWIGAVRNSARQLVRRLDLQQRRRPTSAPATPAPAPRCRRPEASLSDRSNGGGHAQAAPELPFANRGIPMSKTSRLAGVLLLTTALVAPYQAFAQDSAEPPASEPVQARPADTPAPVPPAAEQAEEEVDVSTTGAEIVVTGQRDRNISKFSDQVVPVLSTAEIARTGEGNIAGALGRVTGLSVVGSGYVYVRGLGDRYSLALLNGSPLPSPEPLKRVVPLDIFPSSVISSSLVQKSYSVNYPGEFGGGVINLTTRAVPRDPLHLDRRRHFRRQRNHRPARLCLLRQQDRLDRLRQRPARHSPGACGLLRQRRADELGQGRYQGDRLPADQRPQCRDPELEASAAELYRDAYRRQVLRARRFGARRDLRGRLQQQVADPRRAPAELAERRPFDA